MQSLNSSVVSALKTATAVNTIVSDRIYFHMPPNFNTLPCISYFELNNIPSLFADNQEIGSKITIQIDLWGNSSLTNLAKEVNTVMFDEGFNRIAADDHDDKETGIYNKVMVFETDISDPTF